jgi:glycerol-3-phosphate O-acyltransferase
MNRDEPPVSEPARDGWSDPPELEPQGSVSSELYRSGMLHRFGLLFWLSGLGLFLRPLRLEEHSSDNIRRAEKQGPLVYVMHTRSVLDWIVFNQVLNLHQLPLSRFSNGMRSTIFRPILHALGAWWGALMRRYGGRTLPDPIESGWLASRVSEGMPTCLFLVRSGLVLDGVKGKDPDVVGALVRAQEQCERPIQVVPVVVAWRRGPEKLRSETMRNLLGSSDEPTIFEKIYLIARRTRTSLLQAGEPLDLKLLMERSEGQSRQRRARLARILLRRYLYRESHVIRGPRTRPFRWTRRIVLRSPEVRDLVATEARRTGRSPAEVRSEVVRVHDRIAARMTHLYIVGAAAFCRFLFNRIFSGVDVRPEDLERIRMASRTGTPILVPCHRSHLDYLLISWLCYKEDLALPYIVAGDNLRFFPMGPLFRRMGAFFIKRSFKGDAIFPVVFERYMRQLVRDGYPIEFFIEGGRSRSGKVLPPKLGVLSMVVDAASKRREDRDVLFLPIAISYEQIAEAKAYRRELTGAKKETESVGQIVRARRVLSKRFGRVFLRVGEPISASDFFGEQPRSWSDLDQQHRSEAVGLLGEQIVHRIARQMAVLPTGIVSMALLSQSGSGVTRSQIYDRVQRFDAYLAQLGVEQAGSTSASGYAIEQALARFVDDRLLHLLSEEDTTIYQVIREKRITLEYYKNVLVHFVAPISLMAAAIRGCRAQHRDGCFPLDEVCRLYQSQAFLLRYEFTLDPDISIDVLMERSLHQLSSYGAIEIVPDTQGGGMAYRVLEREWIMELAELTRNFLESYYLVLRACRALRSRDISAVDLPAKIRDVGQGLLAIEELRRPESLSLLNIKNAVKAFREEGLLDIRPHQGGLQCDEGAYEYYIHDMRNLLP